MIRTEPRFATHDGFLPAAIDPAIAAFFDASMDYPSGQPFAAQPGEQIAGNGEPVINRRGAVDAARDIVRRCPGCGATFRDGVGLDGDERRLIDGLTREDGLAKVAISGDGAPTGGHLNQLLSGDGLSGHAGRLPEKPSLTSIGADASPEPPPRHLMTDREAIITRLAEDMLDIRRTRGHVMVSDLMEAGWSIAQVRAYNATAAIHADEIASGARA